MRQKKEIKRICDKCKRAVADDEYICLFNEVDRMTLDENRKYLGKEYCEECYAKLYVKIYEKEYRTFRFD